MANITPSPPIPKLRSHIFAAASLDIFTVALSRLSINIKSFPRPWYLMKSIVRDASATTRARPTRVARACDARGVDLRGEKRARGESAVERARRRVASGYGRRATERARAAATGRARRTRARTSRRAKRWRRARAWCAVVGRARGAKCGAAAGRVATTFVSRRFGAHFSDYRDVRVI